VRSAGCSDVEDVEDVNRFGLDHRAEGQQPLEQQPGEHVGAELRHVVLSWSDRREGRPLEPAQGLGAEVIDGHCASNLIPYPGGGISSEAATRGPVVAQTSGRRLTAGSDMGLRRSPKRAETDVTRRLFTWADARGDLVEKYGSGKEDGSFQAGYQDDAREFFPFALYGYGKIEIQFQYIQRHPSFAGEEARRELLGRLNLIPGVSIGDDMLSKRPSISLAVLTDAAAFARFTGTLDWALRRASEAVDAAASQDRSR
jgi:hypothetical protein